MPLRRPPEAGSISDTVRRQKKELVEAEAKLSRSRLPDRELEDRIRRGKKNLAVLQAAEKRGGW